MKRILSLTLILLLAFIALPALGSLNNCDLLKVPAAYAADLDEYEAPAKEILKGMTLKEKVGQLFMVTPDALKNGGSSITKLTPEMKKKLTKYNLGGVIMFDRHIKTPSQIKKFNKALTNASYDDLGIPIFIAVDEEGGRVTRIAHNSNFDVPKFKSMLAIGNTGKTSKAKNVGMKIGAYLKEYGFTLDLAPVADCFTNPKNTVIGDRSFGADPDLVKKMVASTIKGFHEQGIMTAIKHFPGHGNTSEDTHKQTVKVTKSWAKLKKLELVPFVYNFENTDMIMASHIRCTGVDSNIAPASLSNIMINKKLRSELGYKGIVITDSLDMAAVSSKYDSATAAVKSFRAGCDILLCPVNFVNAYNGVLNAVKDGTISEKRLNKSVLRIIKLKLKYADESN